MPAPSNPALADAIASRLKQEALEKELIAASQEPIPEPVVEPTEPEYELTPEQKLAAEEVELFNLGRSLVEPDYSSLPSGFFVFEKISESIKHAIDPNLHRLLTSAQIADTLKLLEEHYNVVKKYYDAHAEYEDRAIEAGRKVKKEQEAAAKAEAEALAKRDKAELAKVKKLSDNVLIFQLQFNKDNIAPSLLEKMIKEAEVRFSIN